MPNTALQSFPYPALSDAPNGPVALQQLAEALEGTTVFTRASTNMPPHLEGRLVYQTDLDRLVVSNGTAWVIVYPPIQRGTVNTGTFSGANTNKTVAVTFPYVFSSTPFVVANIIAANAVNITYAPMVDGITTSGFNLQVARSTGTGAFDVHWIATL